MVDTGRGKRSFCQDGFVAADLRPRDDGCCKYHTQTQVGLACQRWGWGCDRISGALKDLMATPTENNMTTQLGRPAPTVINLVQVRQKIPFFYFSKRTSSSDRRLPLP
jgi:hypothetical protein